MSNQFIPIKRDSPLVVSVQELLAGDRLAQFIVSIVEDLDVTSLEAAYRGGGSAPYPPKMMLALLFYGYATGIFSSRGLERATYELIPVIYTYWRLEQLLWELLAERDAARLARLRWLARLHGVGWALLVCLLLATLYLDVTTAWKLGIAGAGALLIASSAAGYLALRPGAGRLVWPDSGAARTRALA